MAQKGVTGPFRILVFRGPNFVALERRAFKTRKAAKDFVDRITEYGFNTNYDGLKFRVLKQTKYG